MDMMMMQMMPMMQRMMEGGGRAGVQKWHKKEKFFHLPKAKQELMVKRAKEAAAEGRTPMGDFLHEGTIAKACIQDKPVRAYGWIKPNDPLKLPKEVRDKMNEMTTAKKAKALENQHEQSFQEDMLFFKNADVDGFPAVELKADMEVKFKVYIDQKGAGAYAIVPPAEVIERASMADS
mmetsp:Transcript_68325/g.119106  ORF Transcript_68325/g.119106 Transcript_68325/m.119106 type:complete len:178 (+) Transcript_68325:141-674(+)